MRKFIPTLTLAATLAFATGCIPSTGGLYTDPHQAGQANLCHHIGRIAAPLAWTWREEGHSLDAALDAVDSSFATEKSSAAVRSARDMRRATYVVYAHPHWTESQAVLGVTQDCLRSSVY